MLDDDMIAWWHRAPPLIVTVNAIVLAGLALIMWYAPMKQPAPENRCTSIHQKNSLSTE